MAKAATNKKKAVKKSARVSATAKAAAKSAKPLKKAAKSSKPSRTVARKTAKKIDPLNRTSYRSVTPMLAVSDVRSAIDFYTRALGFKVQGVMDGPQGPVHAELRLRDTTLMLSPEERRQNALSANSIGNTPLTLYMLVEDVDQTFSTAVAGGGKVLMPVMDMFWGDRCGMVADPEGNKWMIATHKSEPTPAEMEEAMRQMQASQSDSQAASAGAGGE